MRVRYRGEETRKRIAAGVAHYLTGQPTQSTPTDGNLSQAAEK